MRGSAAAGVGAACVGVRGRDGGALGQATAARVVARAGACRVRRVVPPATTCATDGTTAAAAKAATCAARSRRAKASRMPSEGPPPRVPGEAPWLGDRRGENKISE